MRINSIFKNRLYALPFSGKITSAEKTIIEKIISKSKCDISIDRLSLVYVEEDYDFYEIKSGNKFYELKFSLDEGSENFNREIKNIKNSKSSCVSRYLDSGVLKIGDNVLYLICESTYSESLFDYGRSQIITGFDSFCRSYSDFGSQSNYRTVYKTLVSNFISGADMSIVFDQDQKSFIDSHSDYNRCELIINNLKSELRELLNKLPKVYTGNILGEFNRNSIFVAHQKFLFKDLRYAVKGHFYSDIANMVLFYGLNKNIENSLLTEVGSLMDTPFDKNLYNQFYQIELRKKVVYYLMQYLKEVYLYESTRVESIINIIDSFSQSYERLCKIEVFKEHREFILKNITEPILEKKPKE